MKLILINPPQIFSLSQISASAVPPLGLLYVATALKEAGHHVGIIDALGAEPRRYQRYEGTTLRGMAPTAIIEQIPKDVEMIGISNLFSIAFFMVAQLSRSIKERFPHVPLVLGGPHPSALPEFSLNHSRADYAVIGDGEETSRNLVDALEAGREPDRVAGLARIQDGVLSIQQKAPLSGDLDLLPIPDRDLIPIENYIQLNDSHGCSYRKRWTNMIATRGCPYRCTFCSIPGAYGGRWAMRSAGSVVDEVEALRSRHGIEEFHFEDDNLCLDRNKMTELSHELIRRAPGISWQTPNAVRSEGLDAEMLNLMRRSGLTHLVLAPESGSPRVLRELMDKRQDLDQVKRVVGEASRQGIKTAAFFILGLPGETGEDLRRTIRYAAALARGGLDEVDFGLFSPIPGSQLFTQLMEERKVVLGEEFFHRFLAQNDLLVTTSWMGRISGAALGRYRMLAHLTFHFSRLLFHPGKIVRSVLNLIAGRQETKTERVLLGLLEKRRELARAKKRS